MAQRQQLGHFAKSERGSTWPHAMRYGALTRPELSAIIQVKLTILIHLVNKALSQEILPFRGSIAAD
jgi:hypothetical protein